MKAIRNELVEGNTCIWNIIYPPCGTELSSEALAVYKYMEIAAS